MHHVAPLRSSLIVDERRRHPRHKPTSIIYVALGPGNGGILTNLSAGGVSLQAAAKLNAETELALNFQLQGAAKAIETVGCVAWLDPTQKEAGISFKDLPGNIERQIADWIARQEQPTRNPQSEPKPLNMPAPRAEPPRPPIQASGPTIFPSEKPASVRPGFVPGILDELLSEPGRQNTFASATAVPPPPPVSVLPAPPFRTPPEEQFESSTRTALRFPARPSGLLVEPPTPTTSVAPPEVLPRDVILPDRGFPSHAIVTVTADPLAPATLDSSASHLRRRRKLAIGLVGGLIGILGLIVTVARVKKAPVANSSGVQMVQPVSPPVAALPEKAPQPKRAAQRHAVGDARPRKGAAGANTAGPVSVEHVAVAPVHQDGGFIERLRALLGLDTTKTIDPATAALPVWTVQHSGFYYCTRSPDFKTLQPGAIMTQGQALQSGYQPKLGDYCK